MHSSFHFPLQIFIFFTYIFFSVFLIRISSTSYLNQWDTLTWPVLKYNVPMGIMISNKVPLLPSLWGRKDPSKKEMFFVSSYKWINCLSERYCKIWPNAFLLRHSYNWKFIYTLLWVIKDNNLIIKQQGNVCSWQLILKSIRIYFYVWQSNSGM